MTGTGFPLIGVPAGRSSYGGLKPAPFPFQPPVDFPMRGGPLPVQQAPIAGNPDPRRGGVVAGPGGLPGGRQGLGARSPVLNPFDRPEQRRRAGLSVLGSPVLGTR